jgi:hypothetical protein
MGYSYFVRRSLDTMRTETDNSLTKFKSPRCSIPHLPPQPFVFDVVSYPAYHSREADNRQQAGLAGRLNMTTQALTAPGHLAHSYIGARPKNHQFFAALGVASSSIVPQRPTVVQRAHLPRR